MLRFQLCCRGGFGPSPVELRGVLAASGGLLIRVPVGEDVCMGRPGGDARMGGPVGEAE